MKHLAQTSTGILLAAAMFFGCRLEIPDAVEDAGRSIPEVIEFNRHIKPILSDRCFSCHGPDSNARKTDMRLDTRDVISTRLSESPRPRAIVPGKPGRSEMLHRLLSTDPEYRMPPPESNRAVSDREIAILIKWIEQGAAYQPHWSFIPPALPELPTESNHLEFDKPIDRFILARLEKEGLSPTPRTDKAERLRRVTFDLTGLPPTIQELDDFLGDESGNAYEKVVDRLLASAAYGERMATQWLDLARYADSHGYQDDGMRNMWPWRDWVISAFNDNMPYDDFVTWQLAGDLLPNATQEQILATGFNRNHLQSQEGGIVPEEYRVEYVADRTNTFGKAFLGLTLECARCHEHKFDPISQTEYYELFAFFNNVNEFGNIPYAGEASPTVVLVDEVSRKQLDEIRKMIHTLESEANYDHADYDVEFANWMAGQETAGYPPDVGATAEARGLIGYYPLEAFERSDELYNFSNLVDQNKAGYFWGDTLRLPTVVPGAQGNGMRLRGDGWLDMGEKRYQFERNEPFSIGMAFFVEKEGTSGPLFTRSGGLFNGLRGYLVLLNEDGSISVSLNHVFPDNSIEIRSVSAVESGKWHQIVVTYDGSSRAEGIAIYLDEGMLESHVVVDNLRQSIVTTIDPTTGDSTTWGAPGNLRIGFVGDNQPKLAGVLVDEFRVFNRRLSYLEARSELGFGDDLSQIFSIPTSDRTAEQVGRLREYFVNTTSPAFRQTLRALTEQRAKENDVMTRLPDVMVMRDRAEPRPTHVLKRGAYDAPLERVEPATPDAILPFADDLPKNRLGLAAWLMDEKNPLTARVEVNRLWQQLFGRGLVETSDNFGSQGQMPSHPDLLDWLARTFVSDGWDVKKMLKRMVMTEAYQRSSTTDPDLLARDPDNELLGRGPSYRLSAEMIRDNALAISGLLVPTIGGPSVRPYQPPGLWKELATRNEIEYKQDHGDKLYRRSMYTIWKRTTPPPSMMSFDASERNLCTVNRQNTNTPLQALVLMNDPQFVEASRILAERTLREGGTTLEDRVSFAFRLSTSRFPLPDELQVLAALYQKELERFVSDESSALAVLETGEYPRDPRLPAPEVAAFSLVASTLLNYDATIMKR